MRSFTVKENHFGSAVSKILRYTQTDILLLIYLYLYHDKVKGCLFVCLFIPKDLANRWADRVLPYRVASHRSRDGL